MIIFSVLLAISLIALLVKIALSALVFVSTLFLGAFSFFLFPVIICIIIGGLILGLLIICKILGAIGRAIG